MWTLPDTLAPGRKPDQKTITKPPDVALRVKLIDGAVKVRGADSARPWTAEPVNFAFQLKPSRASADGQPRLEIEPGVVFSKVRLTPEVCHDLLKYIAPVLADVTEAGGFAQDGEQLLAHSRRPSAGMARGGRMDPLVAFVRYRKDLPRRLHHRCQAYQS